MKLTDADRARVQAIKSEYWSYDGPGLMYSVRELLSIIDRLSQEPEVVRCGECRHSSKIANSTKGERHCWSLRGRNNGDGFSRVRSDGYCDEGERRKEQDDEGWSAQN